MVYKKVSHRSSFLTISLYTSANNEFNHWVTGACRSSPNTDLSTKLFYAKPSICSTFMECFIQTTQRSIITDTYCQFNGNLTKVRSWEVVTRSCRFMSISFRAVLHHLHLYTGSCPPATASRVPMFVRRRRARLSSFRYWYLNLANQLLAYQRPMIGDLLPGKEISSSYHCRLLGLVWCGWWSQFTFMNCRPVGTQRLETSLILELSFGKRRRTLFLCRRDACCSAKLQL